MKNPLQMLQGLSRTGPEGSRRVFPYDGSVLLLFAGMEGISGKFAGKVCCCGQDASFIPSLEVWYCRTCLAQWRIKSVWQRRVFEAMEERRNAAHRHSIR